jgi:transposase
MGNEFTEEELNKFSKKMLVKMQLQNTRELREMKEQLALLTERINVLIKNQYGRSTEKKEELPPGYKQLEFALNEAEVSIAEDGDAKEEDPSFEEVHPRPYVRRTKGQRETELADFPQKDIFHKLTDAERACGCGGTFREVSEEVYKRLVFHKAFFEVEVHHVETASCDRCHTMRRAQRPADLFRNSIATPSLVSAIINYKYVNGVPIYRAEQDFARYEVHLRRQTMASWVIRSAEQYFSLVYDRYRRELLKEGIIHADETPCEVSKDGRKAGSKSYMWVYTGEDAEHPVVVYEYQKTRNGEHVREFLEGFKGFLVSDGYQAYHSLGAGITACGCWAHARRHLANAVSAGADAGLESPTVAREAIDRIAELFHKDNQWKKLPDDEHLRKRQEELKPLAEDFFRWVGSKLTSVPPKSETGKGLAYCINQKEYLLAFLGDARIPLDNSAAERAIRSFTIGRKNFVLIDTVAGAQASAILYSIAETAKLNHLRPFEYFEHLLTEIPRHMEDKELDFVEDLLPWSPALPESCRNNPAKE